MFRVFLATTAFIISVSFTFGQKLSHDQVAVQTTIIKVFDALSNRDSIGLKAQCTTDVLLFEYGKTWTLDTLIRRAIVLNQAKDFERINTIDFINTVVEHDVAWATYYNRADITKNNSQRNVQWIETVVLIRERKVWKIKVLHSSLLTSN